jgi:hypothetical protein
VLGLLRAGDPKQQVWFVWNAKELVRQTYAHTDPELADEWVAEIIRYFADDMMPIEVQRLGRTIKKWAAEITAWHRSHVSNGPTEAVQQTHQARRVRSGQLPTSPSPLPALRRQARLDPGAHDPTLNGGEPVISQIWMITSVSHARRMARADGGRCRNMKNPDEAICNTRHAEFRPCHSTPSCSTTGNVSFGRTTRPCANSSDARFTVARSSSSSAIRVFAVRSSALPWDGSPTASPESIWSWFFHRKIVPALASEPSARS